MKKSLLLFLFLPFIGISQTTRVTVQNGDFMNPLNWTPIGLPTNGDSLVLDHDMIMSNNIWYTDGAIHIRSTGSLIEDATDRSFWIDGGGLYNEGVFTTHLLWLSTGIIDNSGTMASIDSIWNQSTIINAGEIQVYDILNDQTGDFGNSGRLTVTNNFNNQGVFYNGNEVSVDNDFSNCNIQSMDAYFENDGVFCIAADMTNCIGDTLDGSGDYYIGGSSSNFGDFIGTFNFYTPSGTIGVPGNIEGGVTVGIGSCSLSIETTELAHLSIYPNPSTGIVTVSINQVEYVIFDVSGRMVLNGKVENNTIDLSSLDEGIYTVQIGNAQAARLIKR